jgi:sugar lactone lactonase YvrE
MTNELELTAHPASLYHPEGVAWGPDGRVYAGGEAGQVYRLDLDGGAAEEYGNTGGNMLGVALDADTNAYVCDMGLQRVVRVAPDGSWSTYSAGLPDRPMRLPNYAVFDDAGTMYVTDSGEWGDRDGLIWRISADGSTEVWDESAAGFPNGACLSADGGALYVVESSPPQVSRIEIADDGSAGTRSLAVELPRTVPDGVALDVQGNLYVSCYNPNVIYRYDSVGELSVLYDDWEQVILLAPTNIAFGGPDLRTLIVANLFGRNLATAPMGVAGLPLRYPKLS